MNGTYASDKGLKSKTVFLDRDGTIIAGVPYLSRLDQIKLNQNAAEGIRKFKEKGYLVIVITNQSGVARGYFDEDRVLEVNEEMKRILQLEGADIDDIYYCPHMPEELITDGVEPCGCRKPKPQMLLDAAKKYNIDLNRSLMVGDAPGDILAGKNAGCKTALIYKGEDYYDYNRDADTIKPDYVVNDLLEVAALLPV